MNQARLGGAPGLASDGTSLLDVDAVLARIIPNGSLEQSIFRVDALHALSQEHRAVIIETYYRGRSVAEAARVLDIPAGTVKSRCYYALRALRLALLERGVTP